ncbi:MAG: branched-chain amino acid ABC transporter permease [Deltaproteobacteria bacterium]|nr:branched-chain amino acid ABC transporter permease [Deltaproteobacteria bacterium]
MRTTKRTEYLFAAVLLIAGLLVPIFVRSPVWMTVFNIFFFYALLAISYNIVLGYAGLFSFCHVSFGAIGGYTSALLAHHYGLSPFLGLIIGGLAATLCGVALGLTILRVRGFYLCLVTWAFGMVVENVLKNEHHLTGGTGGFRSPAFFDGPHANLYAYFVGLGLLLAVYFISAKLYHSRWGLYLFSVRDDIDAAENLGVNTRFWKVFGFSFGSGLAGLAGAFYAHFFNLVDPTLAGLDEQGKICLMVIIGGLGTVIGPVLGSFFVVIISEMIRGWVAESSLLIFAIIMVLTVRFAQGGFMEIVSLVAPRLSDRIARATPS